MLDMQEWWWLWLLTAWLWGVIVGFLLYLGIERTPKKMFNWLTVDNEPEKPEEPKPVEEPPKPAEPAKAEPPTDTPKPPEERQPGLRDIVAEVARWAQSRQEPVQPPPPFTQPEPDPVPEPEPTPEPEPVPVIEPRVAVGPTPEATPIDTPVVEPEPELEAPVQNPHRLANGTLAWIEIGDGRWVSGESVWKMAVVSDSGYWRVEFDTVHGSLRTAPLASQQQAREFVLWVIGS